MLALTPATTDAQLVESEASTPLAEGSAPPLSGGDATEAGVTSLTTVQASILTTASVVQTR